MQGARRWDEKGLEPLAVAFFVFATVVAGALLIWESRSFTLFVDEWSWGFFARTDLDPDAFLEPHNGHFQAVMVLITKSALQLFGADAAVPLRLLAVAMHLGVGVCAFLLMRQAVGAVAAALPATLVLFLGAANDGIIGSHGMSVTITVLVGLAAWLALRRRTRGWDAAAAALFTIGAATETTVMPFVLGAAAVIALDRESPRSRLWVVAAPVAVYALWWLGWGHSEESAVAVANFAALPAFAFDALAAALGSIAGVFTVTGSRTAGFELAPGQALAGGLLMVTVFLVLDRRYRPGVASLAATTALLSFWVMISGVASPDRQPWSSRFIYISVVLLLLVLVQEIAASPVRRRAALVLAGVCAFSLAPSIRELTYAGDGMRVQAETNRAVMGAADLLAGEAKGSVLLEDSVNAVPGQIVDLGPLEQYEASRSRFGVPALPVAEIEDADSMARAAADRLLARGLEIRVVPAKRPPAPLVGAAAAQTGGVLERVGGCLRFTPLVPGAQVNLGISPPGLWIRPAVGAPVPVRVRRFDDPFGVEAGSAIGGRSSVLALPDRRASTGWKAKMVPDQPLLLCAA